MYFFFAEDLMAADRQHQDRDIIQDTLLPLVLLAGEFHILSGTPYD